jgi:hypothetical protein
MPPVDPERIAFATGGKTGLEIKGTVPFKTIRIRNCPLVMLI